VNPEASGLIFIVDDDHAVAQTIVMMLRSAGYSPEVFSDVEAFLSEARRTIPSAILLDVFMPGKTGLDLLRELPAASYPAPIMMISGRGEIPLAIESIKIGACDFIEKPFRASLLVEKLQTAIRGFVAPPKPTAGIEPDAPKLSKLGALTPREQDVLAQLARGETNKEMARNLKLSPRTIEEYRASMMRKLGARNTADLMRLALTSHGAQQK
jgi:FixJ family two-component response regulator